MVHCARNQIYLKSYHWIYATYVNPAVRHIHYSWRSSVLDFLNQRPLHPHAAEGQRNQSLNTSNPLRYQKLTSVILNLAKGIWNKYSHCSSLKLRCLLKCALVKDKHPLNLHNQYYVANDLAKQAWNQAVKSYGIDLVIPAYNDFHDVSRKKAVVCKTTVMSNVKDCIIMIMDLIRGLFSIVTNRYIDLPDL